MQGLPARSTRPMAKVLAFAWRGALSTIVALPVLLTLLALRSAPVHTAWLAIAALVVHGIAVTVVGRIGLAKIGRLQGLSRTDSLSELPNRRALHDDARRLQRNGGEIGIALIDLDGFKLINDQYGHGVGDAAIAQFGALLRECCGTEAQGYRLGGDEFAVMKVGPLAGAIVESITRVLIDRLRRALEIGELRIMLGMSAGLARAADGEPIDSGEVLRRADVAMYASKRGGKMRCTWYSADFDRTRSATHKLSEELRLALTRDEFSVAYQPLVDARSGKVVAAECLVRWERPDGRRIGPDTFIPVAEETGLIDDIGLFVMNRACRDALPWAGIKLSVNVSAAQLRNPAFPIQLGQILEETGFPPERLELEVTETCLVTDPLVAERTLNVIREFGVDVALDDFGTGYASIGFLRQFRFEKLKIDRSLVTQAQRDDGSRAMMLSSITVARALKMGVTAEGVETEEQAELVRAAGCDQIQGWLYFKAMPAAEVERHLGITIKHARTPGSQAA